MGGLDAIDTLSLEALEEASGELHRRIGAALRRIGEADAERTDEEGHSPRWRVAALASAMELASTTLAAVAAGGPPPSARHDRHAAVVSALMYAAPSIPALLARLDQDRRMLASLARSLEPSLGETRDGPWGTRTVRGLLSEIAIAEPARCAQALERDLATLDAERQDRAREGDRDA